MSRLLRTLPLFVLLVPLLFVFFGQSRGRAARTVPQVAPGAGFPVRIELAGDDHLLIERPPRRILPANAGAVDFVTQLVGPARVAALPKAADSFSRLREAPEGWEGLPRFEGYVAETILALNADLVIAHGWQSPETTAILRKAGVPVLICPLPVSWSDITETLHLIAAALGEGDRADELAEALQLRREALRGTSSNQRAISYSNLGSGGSIAGSGTTANILLELVGLRNAAAHKSGYQPIDLEGLLVLAPDIIIVGASNSSEGISSTEELLRNEPLLSELPALTEGRIVTLPQEYFTTSSTELLEAAEYLSAALNLPNQVYRRTPGG